MKTYKIFCCYHNPSLLPSYAIDESWNDEYFELVNGKLDPLNMYLSEFSMFKYIIDNDFISKYDYIGTCHYSAQIAPVYRNQNLLWSRHFNPEILNFYDENTIFCLLIKYNCGISQSVFNTISIKDNILYYVYNHYCDVIGKSYLKYDYNDPYNNNIFIAKESAIMISKNFKDLYEFIYGYVKYLFLSVQLPLTPEGCNEFIKKYVIDYNISINKFTDICNGAKSNIYSIDNYDFNINRVIAYTIEFIYSLYISRTFYNYVQL